jgi:hypothetical protein
MARAAISARRMHNGGIGRRALLKYGCSNTSVDAANESAILGPYR